MIRKAGYIRTVGMILGFILAAGVSALSLPCGTAKVYALSSEKKIGAGSLSENAGRGGLQRCISEDTLIDFGES